MDGGIGWLQLGLLSVTLSLAGEAFVRLWPDLRTGSGPTRAVLAYLRGSGDVAESLRFRGLEQTATGRVLRAALLRVPQGAAVIGSTADAALRTELANVRRRAGALTVTAAVSVLLGLLGTIVAICGGSYHHTASSRSAAIAGQLAEALPAVGVGLAVALLALSAHGLIAAARERVTHELRRSRAELSSTLSEVGPWIQLHGLRAPRDTWSYRR